MTSLRTALFGLLLWIKYQSVQNQCWNGYSSGSPWDAYGQSYNYAYGQYDHGYDYNAAPTIYISTYPQTSNYDYYQQHYNAYPNDNPQPIVVVINGNDHDDDLYDVLNYVTSLNNKHNNEPIYIPYPVPVPSYDSCGSDYGNTDCGCRSCDCGCSNKASCCDCGCNGDNNCGCSDCKKRRSKSKCGRNSGCGCSNSDCGCNKSIKHKNDRCYC